MKSFITMAVLFFSMASFADTCFDSGLVRNWDYKSETGVLTVNTMRGNYDVQLSVCNELPWAQSIAFKSFFGSDVCRGDKVLVLNGFDRVVEACHIMGVTKK